MSDDQVTNQDPYTQIAAFETQAARAAHARNFPEAIDAHCRALLIARDLARPRLSAVLFGNLGRTLNASNRVQDTVTAYEAGLRALDASDHFDLQDVLQNLGLITKGYGDVRDFTMPDVYRPATFSEIHQAENDPQLAVKLLVDIGNAYLRQPQEQPALNAYQRALDCPEIHDDPPLRAQALANIGEVYRRQGNLDKAEQCLREAIDILKGSHHPEDARRALALLAGIVRDRKQFAEALSLYHEALALYDEQRDSAGKARALAGLGQLYLVQEQYAEANNAYQQAIDLANDTNDSDALWHAHWGIGCCQEQNGEWVLAEKSFRESLTLIQGRMNDLRTDEGKVTFLETVQDIFDRLLSVILKQDATDSSRFARALAVAEDARGQALMAMMGRSSRNTAPQARPAQPVTQSSFDQVFSRLIVQAAPAIVVPTTSLAEDTSTAQTNNNRQVSQSRQQGVKPMPVLPRLVFHVLVDSAIIFVALPDGTVHGQIIHQTRDALEQQIHLVRRMLCSGDELRGITLKRHVRLDADDAEATPTIDSANTDPYPMLRALYDTLIGPIIDKLPTDSTALVIEPHCGLWRLPFAALQAPDGRFLCDQFALLYTPSADVLADIRNEPDYGEPKTLRALIVGNPEMPKKGLDTFDILKLDPLPGAEQEAHHIAELFPLRRRKLLTQTRARRIAIVEIAQNYGILHLATHGLAFAHKPLDSFIVLAESKETLGLLTARDVMTMYLPADLVTLSACQTGLGQVSGDGMVGLCRAFLVAGARAVLVSQWSISDEATAKLMLAFYQQYLVCDNKAIALQLAMRELRKDPRYQHPSFWAAFTLVGAEA